MLSSNNFKLKQVETTPLTATRMEHYQNLTGKKTKEATQLWKQENPKLLRELTAVSVEFGKFDH